MARVGIRAIVDSLDMGEGHVSWFYKSSSTGNGIRWLDLSMAPGVPRYNAYVGTPLEFTPLSGSANNGIFLGAAPPVGKKRVVTKVGILSTNATSFVNTFLLADYLGFYPLIDGDSTDPQDLDNPTGLPRYDSADGVMCVPVCYSAQATDALCTVTYTNSGGVGGRTSTFMLLGGNGVGAVVGTAGTVNTGRPSTPFMPLQNGDRGVRSVESFVMSAPVGGFVTLVLVKPLASLQTHERNTFCEKDLIRENACVTPAVESGAYLNLLYAPAVGGSITPVLGFVEFAWRDA